MTSRDIRIVTVLGSIRPGNMTAKALALVNDELGRLGGVTVTMIDPASLNLTPPGGPVNKAAVEQLKQAVTKATGIVLATPEYHGSYSSGMKLVIDNMGFPSPFGGKPIALLGVAAGTIGAIKALEHLRSVSSHIGGIVLPGPVSVASVNSVFDDDGNCLDERIEKRIRGLAHTLVDYIEKSICPGIALEAMVRSGE